MRSNLFKFNCGGRRAEVRPRVVITGIGLVTALGQELDVFWDRLLSGASGITPVESFDSSRYRVHCGAEVKGFHPEPGTWRCDVGDVGRAFQFAISAAAAALRDGVDTRKLLGHRWSLFIGTTSGEPQEIERYDDSKIAADENGRPLLSRYPCHLLAANVAEEFGITGGVSVVPAACAAGNHALARAVDSLRSGRADWVLAGGADCFSRITFSGFARLAAIAKERCQPFDLNRQGMIPGEGSAMLLLERMEKARSRRARIYAEVAGYGLSCDAHHMTGAHPLGLGAVRAMENALADARVDRRDISYISAHGTGTRSNDHVESLTVKTVFTREGAPPMSSIKSMLGHAMGAASAIEAAVCALVLKSDKIPPTINYCDPDPECDLDYVPNTCRELPVRVAMNNAYAFGGTNSSLLLRKC
jgi:3-oxoacyl-[acyl-carrier-protein] synthase II